MASRPFSARPNRLLLPLVAFFALILAEAAWPGGTGLADEAAGSVKSRDVPIVVTARTLVADNKKKTAVYKTGVVVKKGDMTLYADEVTVRLKEKEPGKGPGSAAKDKPAKGESDIMQGAGKIDTIEARGSVKIIQQDKTATSDEATYYSASDKIVLTGKPRVWQGDNVITGNIITYNVKDDTFVVDEANTILYQGQGSGPGSGKAESGK